MPRGFEASPEARAQADLKFTYVVSCQIYGQQKQQKKPEATDIALLLQRYALFFSRQSFVFVYKFWGYNHSFCHKVQYLIERLNSISVRPIFCWLFFGCRDTRLTWNLADFLFYLQSFFFFHMYEWIWVWYRCYLYIQSLMEHLLVISSYRNSINTYLLSQLDLRHFESPSYTQRMLVLKGKRNSILS